MGSPGAVPFLLQRLACLSSFLFFAVFWACVLLLLKKAPPFIYDDSLLLVSSCPSFKPAYSSYIHGFTCTHVHMHMHKLLHAPPHFYVHCCTCTAVVTFTHHRKRFTCMYHPTRFRHALSHTVLYLQLGSIPRVPRTTPHLSFPLARTHNQPSLPPHSHHSPLSSLSPRLPPPTLLTSMLSTSCHPQPYHIQQANYDTCNDKPKHGTYNIQHTQTHFTIKHNKQTH